MLERKRNTFIPLWNRRRQPCRPMILDRAIAFIPILLILWGSLSCGRQEITEPKSEKNSAPSIISIRILPEHPTKRSILSLFIQSKDPDGKPVVYRYQWLRNNEEMSGEDKETLKCDDLKKGDLIQVRVIPSDGTTNGESFLSASAKILNSVPVIQEVRIEPKLAGHEDLKVFTKGSDADGDSVQYTYQWEKNGVSSGEEKTEILERKTFRKGDSIAVIVTPSDGESTGMSKKSEPTVIPNSPPIIVSSPSNGISGGVYTYQVKADDPDNDPITFSLKSGPKGMEINQETGLIRWQLGKGDRGTQTVEIEASDTEGAKSLQRYTLAIEFR
jgi:hypothetical protein